LVPIFLFFTLQFWILFSLLFNPYIHRDKREVIIKERGERSFWPTIFRLLKKSNVNGLFFEKRVTWKWFETLIFIEKKSLRLDKVFLYLSWFWEFTPILGVLTLQIGQLRIILCFLKKDGKILGFLGQNILELNFLVTLDGLTWLRRWHVAYLGRWHVCHQIFFKKEFGVDCREWGGEISWGTNIDCFLSRP
jgi:hypothetical protein